MDLNKLFFKYKIILLLCKQLHPLIIFQNILLSKCQVSRRLLVNII